MIRYLLAQADALGAGLITWKWTRCGHVDCFASGSHIPCRARGKTALDALRELVRFLRRTR